MKIKLQMILELMKILMKLIDLKFLIQIDIHIIHLIITKNRKICDKKFNKKGIILLNMILIQNFDNHIINSELIQCIEIN